MRQKTIILKSLLLAPLFAAAPFSQAAGAEAGKALFATCSACHGQAGEGITAMNTPALAGQSQVYLARQLHNFRNGIRGGSGDTLGAQMSPMAKILADDTAVNNVTAYIASLPSVTPAATVAGDAVAGNKLYQSYCGACHGSSGQGNDALHAPRLVGLGDTYVIRQYQNFAKGIRGKHPDDKYGRQMQMMSTLLDDQQLEDVAAFLNSKSE